MSSLRTMTQYSAAVQFEPRPLKRNAAVLDRLASRFRGCHLHYLMLRVSISLRLAVCVDSVSQSQAADIVAYFPQGHAEFLSAWTEPPVSEHVFATACSILRCVVVELNFVVGPQTRCRIRLEVKDGDETGMQFEFRFFDIGLCRIFLSALTFR
jgi:hypothetical protein